MALGTDDLQARTPASHEKHNMIYMSNSVRIMRAALLKYQALSIIFDEARFTNAQILQVVAVAPLDSAASQGVVLPPQVMPEMFISLHHRKLNLRISDAMEATAAEAGVPAAGAGGRPTRRRGTNKKPCADPLVCTWQSCLGIDNALCCIVAEGISHFLPQAGPKVVQAGQHYKYNETHRAWFIDPGRGGDWERVCAGHSANEVRIYPTFHSQHAMAHQQYMPPIMLMRGVFGEHGGNTVGVATGQVSIFPRRHHVRPHACSGHDFGSRLIAFRVPDLLNIQQRNTSHMVS